MATIVHKFPNFQNCARCGKDLKDNKDNSLHLGRNYARIFVLGHYLFLLASLSENCLLVGTDIVRGQISEHIFAPNDGYCLYCNEIDTMIAQAKVRELKCITVVFEFDTRTSAKTVMASNECEMYA